MRADPQSPRRSSKHLPVWIIAGVAALLCIPGAVWWIGESPRPGQAEILPAQESAPAPADEAAASAAEPPVPDERDATGVERAGVDASTFYKDAFALFDRLTDAEKEMMRGPNEEVDAEKADALFAKIQPIMELLRRGAAADYCDWGLGPIGFDTPLPLIAKSQQLAMVALWNAAYRFPSDAEGAIDDLAARARLGHDVADTLIGWLVEASFEKSATGLLLQNASSLSDNAQARARDFLGSSSLDMDMERAMSAEIEQSQGVFERLAAQQPEERPKFAQLQGPDRLTSSEEDRMFEQFIRDPARLKAEAQDVRNMQSQMTEAMFWPDARFAEWAQQFSASHASEHPLVVSAFESMPEIRAKLQIRRIEREMMNAGITVLQSGPEQLSQSRDPVTGRPFAYVPTPDGFELRSTFQVKGKPMTMTFAQPKQ